MLSQEPRSAQARGVWIDGACWDVVASPDDVLPGTDSFPDILTGEAGAFARIELQSLLMSPVAKGC